MPHIRAGAVIYANNYERLSSFYGDVAGLDVRETDETSTILESENLLEARKATPIKAIKGPDTFPEAKIITGPLLMSK
jgi:hypothetical protein